MTPNHGGAATCEITGLRLASVELPARASGSSGGGRAHRLLLAGLRRPRASTARPRGRSTSGSATTASATTATSASGARPLEGSSSPGSGRWKVALPADTSSKAMVRGLPDTEVTWGGTTYAHALAELVVVRVDLPGPLGRQGHQRELGVHLVEEVLDGGIHERVAALGHSGSSRGLGVGGPAATRRCVSSIPATASIPPWSTSSFDHDIRRDLAPQAHLLGPVGHAPLDLGLVVAPAAQTLALHLGRGRHEEHEHGVGVRAFDLHGPPAGRSRAPRRCPVGRRAAGVP